MIAAVGFMVMLCVSKKNKRPTTSTNEHTFADLSSSNGSQGAVDKLQAKVAELEAMVAVQAAALDTKDAETRQLKAKLKKALRSSTKRPAAAAAVEAQLAELQRENAALRLAAPRPPASVTFFRSEKYLAAWAMLLTIFPSSVTVDIQKHATELSMVLARFLGLARDFLFDRNNWHPAQKGGGVHMAWPSYNDGYTGLNIDGRPHYYLDEEGNTQNMPSYGGIPYATRRMPLVAAIEACKPSALALMERVQELADRTYGLVPGPKGNLTPVKKATGVGQPVPPEFRGKRYKARTDVPAKTLAQVSKAMALVQAAHAAFAGGGAEAGHAVLPYVDPEEYERLEDGLTIKISERGANRMSYAKYVWAMMLLASSAFHEAMDTVFAGLGSVKHATMKSVARSEAKVESDYLDMPMPQFQHLTDVLRVTVEVDDHRALEKADAELAKAYTVVARKDRLDKPTHDVLVVIEFDGGVLCEVQFSFRSVLLIKSFAHTAYAVARLDTSSNQVDGAGISGAITGLLRAPMRAGMSVGGYESRARGDITLRLDMD